MVHLVSSNQATNCSTLRAEALPMSKVPNSQKAADTRSSRKEREIQRQSNFLPRLCQERMPRSRRLQPRSRLPTAVPLTLDSSMKKHHRRVCKFEPFLHATHTEHRRGHDTSPMGVKYATFSFLKKLNKIERCSSATPSTPAGVARGSHGTFWSAHY